ncbi:hypothetical protein LCGC14_2445900 [marine sediment metagenome]|uniref:Uncharacterized protein n=1 Tax=marine sediment metagenome TaxID=412755 RepID=A0A0F9C528_9ZZZZ
MLDKLVDFCTANYWDRNAIIKEINEKTVQPFIAKANSYDSVKVNIEKSLGRFWRDAEKYIFDGGNSGWSMICNEALENLVDEFGDKLK